MIRVAVAVTIISACATEPIVVAPVIDSPPAGSTADPFGVIDSIELQVAIDGELDALVSQTFQRGETVELRDVPYGENLVIHMIGRVGTTVYAVGRTCRFSIHPDEEPLQPHLYFAREVSWAASGTPAAAVRVGGAALTHHDGSALFLGGRDAAGAAVLAIDRFEPMTGAFVGVAGVAARDDGAVAALGDGRVVIAGGLDPGTGAAATSLEVVVVDQNRVEPIAAGPLVTSTTPALATLGDGRIVAFGGRDAAGTPLDQVVEIDGETAGVTLRVLQRAKLATPRHGHTATRISDDLGAPVLIAGGLDAAGAAVKPAELYKPLLEQMTPTFTAAMVVERHAHRAVRLPDGSILIVGGREADGTPVTALEVFTLEGGFQQLGQLPPNAGVTDQSVTPLPDGRILIAGGLDAAGAPVSAAFIASIDPIASTIDVVTTDPLATARSGHQAAILCDGTIMLVGGTTTASPAERYNPTAAGRR